MLLMNDVTNALRVREVGEWIKRITIKCIKGWGGGIDLKMATRFDLKPAVRLGNANEAEMLLLRINQISFCINFFFYISYYKLSHQLLQSFGKILRLKLWWILKMCFLLPRNKNFYKGFLKSNFCGLKKSSLFQTKT